MNIENNNQYRALENELSNVAKLHFDKESLEDAFSKQFIENNRARYQISCIIAIITLTLFMFQDLATFPEESIPVYLIIRAGICIPFLIASFFISQMPSMRKQLPYWIITAILLLGLGNVAIVAINYSNGYVSPYEGILLTIIASYFLVGLDFRSATMSSVLIVIGYLYSTLAIYDDFQPIYYNLSFVIITLLICAVGGFGVEKQLRINFLNNEILTILSQRDGLTDIYNRTTLEHKLKWAIRASLREYHGIAFALIDIDFFKNYNDHYGHLMGDKAIKAVAQSLQKNCKRPTDFCARYGGEEFVIVWYPTRSNAPENLQKALQNGIKDLKIPHIQSSISDYLTVSGGIVYYESNQPVDNDYLLKLADSALYQAKNEGRNQFKIIDASQLST